MTDRHLVGLHKKVSLSSVGGFTRSAYHLLDFYFLERREFACSRLHVQLSAGIVRLAVDRDALGERSDGLLVDFLEDFASARVAREGRDEQEGLDFRDTRDNTSDGDELAKVLAFYVSNR